MEALYRALSAKVALVVEDDECLATVLGLVMEEHSIPTVVLHTADAALEWLSENPNRLGLLLTDITMPGLNTGTDLAKWVASNQPEIPIILMSGNHKEVDFPKCMFLRKPVSMEKLIRELRNAFHPEEISMGSWSR